MKTHDIKKIAERTIIPDVILTVLNDNTTVNPKAELTPSIIRIENKTDNSPSVINALNIIKKAGVELTTPTCY